MSAACAASSPCARQRGAAVLLAILTVALAALLAAAILRDYGAAVAARSGRHDQAQARLLARGAVDWARNVLAEDARTTSIDYAGEAWAVRVPPTPVEEGEVAGEIEDVSGRFDLNSLVKNGIAEPAQVAAYVRLLGLLGFPEARAQALAAALLDWIDADEATAEFGAEASWYATQRPPRRPPNRPLVDVDELRLLRGYDAAAIEALRPFVVALPSPAPLNVNTASAQALAAILPGLSLDGARIMAAQQLHAPFKDVADFVARMPASAQQSVHARLAVTSRYFLVSGRARFGEATTRMQVLLERQHNWAAIVWRKML